MGTCVSTKLRFPDEEEAALALEEVRAKRRRQKMPEARIEKRYYGPCKLCRGGYHLTSKTLEEMGTPRDDTQVRPDPRDAGPRQATG